MIPSRCQTKIRPSGANAEPTIENAGNVSTSSEVNPGSLKVMAWVNEVTRRKEDRKSRSLVRGCMIYPLSADSRTVTEYVTTSKVSKKRQKTTTPNAFF